MQKTNAARLLDQKGISYNLVEYDVDESDLSAVHVAAQLNQDIGQVFKTLILRGDKTGIFVCIIPGGDEVDLKKTAKASGNKSCAMVAMKEILGLTGYIRGGCSPIGMKKNYPTFIDEQCQLYDTIFISAGIRGMQIEIAPNDLVKMTGCLIGELV
jgi:Cys-tRNA(Pro)/Cys-tRNA(Cys) deacylase